jgi:hypothetical protein
MMVMKNETNIKNNDLRHIYIPSKSSKKKKDNVNLLRYKISEKKLLILQNLTSKKNEKDSSQQSHKYSVIYQRYYNKCPLESMNVFKNIYRNRNRIDCNKELDMNVMNKKTRRQRKQYKNFKKEMSNRHPFKKQNFGILFNTPEFIQFKILPKRLKEEINLQRKNFYRIHLKSKSKSKHKKNNNMFPFKSSLRKRSSKAFNNNKKSSNLFQYKNTPFNENHSFFESSQSNSVKQNFIYEKLLTRSYDDIKFENKRIITNPFLSYKQSISKSQQYNTQVVESSDDSNEILKMLKKIQMIDIKETSDSEFRKTVIQLCKEFSHKKLRLQNSTENNQNNLF